MKIRIGFISNSSSTSFCIHGIAILDNKFAELFGYNESDDDEYSNNKSELISEKLEELLKDSELSYYYDSDMSDEIYIGKSYLNMNMTETRSDFEKDIENKIEDIFDKYDIDTNFISVCRSL